MKERWCLAWDDDEGMELRMIRVGDEIDMDGILEDMEMDDG